MYQFAFISDYQLGWRTQALNLKRVVAQDASIDPVWVPVLYESAPPWPFQFPAIPAGVAGTLRGIQEIRSGLRGARPDAILWATWAAKSVPDLVQRTPSFLVMDMTPVQMEAMGHLYDYPSARADFLRHWKRLATVKLYQCLTHIFPLCDWVAKSLQDDYGVAAEKITTISPGVDVELYRPAPDEKAPRGVIRLLFVGGDFKRKGGDLLLRWAREHQHARNWEIHIVTRDPVPTIPRVIVHHNVANNSDELVRLYQQSDVFVLPTRADCYSLVAMEAMASGLPVVIAGLGGIPEIVSDGDNGFVIRPDDYDALVRSLQLLLHNDSLRHSMSKQSRRRACAQFSCRSNIGRILHMMKEASHQRHVPLSFK